MALLQCMCKALCCNKRAAVGIGWQGPSQLQAWVQEALVTSYLHEEAIVTGANHGNGFEMERQQAPQARAACPSDAGTKPGSMLP